MITNKNNKSAAPPTLLIESQYLGNLHYFARILHHKKVLIEQHEHFPKATYRNRTHIAMPDRVLCLSIPLKKGKHSRCPMKEVRISADTEWQKVHWKGISISYRSSPYFEFYEDDLWPFYHKKYDFLLDFNNDLLQFVLEQLTVSEAISVDYTNEFFKQYDAQTHLDFRSAILPNTAKQRPDEAFKSPVYHQLFEEKIGFLPNLSIIDLLFAEGPNTAHILQQSMR